jgi:hypothetical protein
VYHRRATTYLENCIKWKKKIKSKIEIALLVFFKAFKKQLNEHLFIRNELMKNTREVIQKVDFFKLEISI